MGSVKHERGKLLNIMQNLKQMQQPSKPEKKSEQYQSSFHISSVVPHANPLQGM